MGFGVRVGGLWVVLIALGWMCRAAENPSPPEPERTAKERPLPGEFVPSDIESKEGTPQAVLSLIEKASRLSKMRLGYRYGSADPAVGAMDCSGAIFRLLNDAGLKDVPRQSDEIYKWVWRGSRVYPVVGRSKKSFEMEKLRPGDLLFWTGTYSVDREVPISHVMIYLGNRKSDGRPVMFGSSDGRTYEGKSCFGVGVFDFLEPKANAGTARFVGYGPIPGIDTVR